MVTTTLRSFLFVNKVTILPVVLLLVAASMPSVEAILPSVVNAPRDITRTAPAAPKQVSPLSPSGGGGVMPAIIGSGEEPTVASSANPPASSPAHLESHHRMPVAKGKVITGTVASDDALLSDAVQWQHRSLYQELRDEDQAALADVGMLWQTAIERSGTIRFAIEKLSRKNAVGDDPTDSGFAQQMIKQVARLGGAAGSMWTGTPAGFIGGSMVEDLIQTPGKQVAASQMRVTDADMVLLAKEVESLQADLIAAYYAYRHATQRLEAAHQAQEELGRYETLMPASVQAALLSEGDMPSQASRQLNTIALVTPLIASVVANVDDMTRQAQQEVLSAKEALTLLVGSDAIQALDNADSPPETASSYPNSVESSASSPAI